MLVKRGDNLVLRASYGTLSLLGLVKNSKIKMDTAYFMLDGRCMFNCAFCAHARDARTENKFLSRIVWKEISVDMIEKLDVKRICLQVVSYKGYKEDLENLLLKLNGKKVSVSVRALSMKEIDRYFELGADAIGLSFDVVNKELFEKIRGGKFENTLELIKNAAKKYPGHITTHVIVGLGETDKELIEFFYMMKELNVLVALFSFTPIKGTAFENLPSPSMERYRKIQLARYLIFEEDVPKDVFVFNKERLEKINYPFKNGLGKAFLTSGCSHCTRPYYNEKPSKEPYNYFEYANNLEEIAKKVLE